MTLTRFRWVADPAALLAHALPLRGSTAKAVCGVVLADELPTAIRVDARCRGCLAGLGLPPFGGEASARKVDPPAPVVRRVDAGGH